MRAEARYTVPRHPAPTDLWLAGNEGRTPPPTLVQDLDPALRAYPDARPLEADLARRFGPAQVLVTAGADDGLDRVCRAWLDASRRLLAPVPTFGMLLKYARLTGATVDTVPWPDGPPWRPCRETQVTLRLCLDGTGQADINTGIGFLDHLLGALTLHGRFDLDLRCVGDLHVDCHHTAEDCAPRHPLPRYP